MKALVEFLEQLRVQARYISDTKGGGNETMVRKALVEPVLRWWGWDVEDVREVQPEIKAGRSFLDYVLVMGERPCVVVECKAIHKKLSGDERSQIGQQAVHLQTEYGAGRGRLLLVLTNGVEWQLLWNDSFREPFAKFNLWKDEPAPLAFVRALFPLWKENYRNVSVEKDRPSEGKASPIPSASSSGKEAARWQRLAAVDPASLTGKRPRLIKTPEGAEVSVRRWIDMVRFILNYYIDKGVNLASLAPLAIRGSSRTYLFNTQPSHKEKPFRQPEKAGNVIIEKNLPTSAIMRGVQAFLSRMPDGARWALQMV